MLKPSSALLFSSLIRLIAAQSQTGTNSEPANQTVLVTTSGKSTWSETFIPTSLSQYATISHATTVTTTDASGAVAVAAVFAGGLAWWFFPKAGAPIIDPPTVTPTPPKTIETGTSTTRTSTSTTKSSTSSVPTAQQTAHIFNLPSDYPSLLSQKVITFVDDSKTCGFANDDPAVMSRDPASDKIDTFCKDNNGKKVLVGAPLEGSYDLGGGQLLNITVQQNTQCSSDKDQILFQSDCSYFLHQALDGCDTSLPSTQKHGGSVNDACYNYILHPQDNDGELACTGNGAGTGINRDSAIANIAAFCKTNAGSSVSPNQGNLLSYHQNLGDSQATIYVSYNGACKRGSGAFYQIDERACNRFLAQTIDGCNTDFKGPYGKYGGNVTDNCGIFEFEAKVVEKLGCGDNPDMKPPHVIAADDAAKAIDEYCNSDLTLDPNYKDAGGFSQYQPEGLSYDNYSKGLNHYVIRMFASFIADQSGCSTKQKFSTKGDECKRKLNAIMSACSGKAGGYLTDKTENGCVAWEIFGQGT